ncbi:uncharacterized protein LOC120282666 [Dioscorea cayenensis subsp. rotundata]|uniref:RNA-directed DNA polymerase n=1 Tax=Dioscorea cayennensis subsp. rotundata TaxID=55577 RepID=A0AB40CZM3_DIOCR|nr:uncharacterized protein LOC120282666 [Dioscorea cayenensis subsp. rotundata]
MVTETRYQALETAIEELKLQQQEDRKRMESRLEDLFQLMTSFATKAEATKGVKEVGATKEMDGDSSPTHLGSVSKLNRGPSPSNPAAVTTPKQLPENGMFQLRASQLEFPKFNGDEAKEWVATCNQFFEFCTVSENAKVPFASMYFSGQATSWYNSYRKKHPGVSWDQFVVDLLYRFHDEENDSLVGEFSKLRHTTTVEDYQNRYEELLPYAEEANGQGFTKQYLIESCLSGLKEEVKVIVKLFKPNTVSEVFNVAKLVESGFHPTDKRIRAGAWRSPPRPKPNLPLPPLLPTPPLEKKLPTATTSLLNMNPSRSQTIPTARKLTPDEYQRRKEQNLCFNCEEKFFKGHQCNKRQLYYIATDENEEGADNLEHEQFDVQEEDPEILMFPVNAVLRSNAVCFKGNHKGTEMSFLIDCGAAESFINRNTAHKLQCKLDQTTKVLAVSYKGDYEPVDKMCKNFPFNIKGYDFTADLRVVPVDGYDALLGLDWLEKMDVTCNFKSKTLFFDYKGEAVKIQGDNTSSIPKVSRISAIHLQQCDHQQIAALGFIATVKTDSSGDLSTDLEVISLLRQFSDVFTEPKGLPPPRTYDHQIPLKVGAEPFKFRAYRYPFIQKQEIEWIVKELLSNGVIQESNSPFASPVLLVKKKDGSWRSCVDYRELNRLTIKDKFPIPLVDELLDELHGALFYSKLDLRSGYHQIRVQPQDIFKTAFRTHMGHYEFKVMPFGLTNAPATFQALMNSIFQPFLLKFVLVFFDDILVYSRSWRDHLMHLQTVLQVLRDQQLFAEESKCSFGQSHIEYLGHIISVDGVSADKTKVQAMLDWPTPKGIIGLRGFLGLTGYYRKFVKGYRELSRPLNQLLKKDKFLWDDSAHRSFELLKQAMSSTPVLGLLDFTKPFVIETDASATGLGAVLMQDGPPLAYMIQSLANQHLGLSTYEREIMAIVQAVNKWRPYLLGHKFIVKTDHQSLKFFIEQRLSTIIQQKWLSRLMGFEFEIQYKKGSSNVVADALSRQQEELPVCALSCVTPKWMLEIGASYEADPTAAELLARATLQSSEDSHISFTNGVIRINGKFYVGPTGLRPKIISEFHSSAWGGHSGVTTTLKKIQQTFYWPTMIQDVKTLIAECQVCQTCKSERFPYPGLLQPLDIPEQPWVDISMDFIDGLPSSEGKTSIWVVVDRFSKMAHFLALKHPFMAQDLATLFMDQIHRLHGMPRSIKMSPFEALYGFPPHGEFPPNLNSSHTGLEQFVSDRAAMLAAIKTNLQLSQERMKWYADQHRSEREFTVGDWVYLKLHPYRQTSTTTRPNQKLAPRFFGPFQVLARVGKVVYTLALPEGSSIHPTFHVSLLKQKLGAHEVLNPSLPPVGPDGQVLREPMKILDRRIYKKGTVAGVQALVQWVGFPEKDATWEDLDSLQALFPSISLDVLSTGCRAS